MSSTRSFRCRRCEHAFGRGSTCQECGVGRYRSVRSKHHRCRKIGGKRAQNSGKS